MSFIAPRACERDKVIGLSICCRCCPQNNGKSQDVDIMMSSLCSWFLSAERGPYEYWKSCFLISHMYVLATPSTALCIHTISIAQVQAQYI